jgi:uncharacterized alpha-E superfamily protein
MMRRFYKKTPNSVITLEFLILNPDCPRSIMNCLNQVCYHIKTLDQSHGYNKSSTAFLVGKVRAEYQFKVIEEIEGDVKKFIESILESLAQISRKMEKEFFDY